MKHKEILVIFNDASDNTSLIDVLKSEREKALEQVNILTKTIVQCQEKTVTSAVPKNKPARKTGNGKVGRPRKNV